MDDSQKTKEQLIEEMAALRQQLAARQTGGSRPTHLDDNPAARAAQLSVRHEASQLDPTLPPLPERRLEQAEAIQSIMIELTRELDLNTLMEMIIERVAQLVEVTAGVVLLWDHNNQRLIPKAWIGVGDWIGEVSWTLGQGVVGVAAQRRQALLVDDYQTSPYAISPFTERCTFTSVIAEPLLYRNRLVGAIALTHEHEPRTFTPEDQELLRLFATPAAIALENARLFEESKQRQKWLSSILSINQRMASSTNMETLLAQISAEAAQLIGADGAGIRLLQDDHFVAIESSKYGDNTIFFGPPKIPLKGNPFIASLFGESKAIVIPNIQKEPGFRYKQQAAAAGVHAEVIIPMRNSRDTLGHLAIVGRQPRHFRQDELDALVTYAEQAAIAIKNARLVHEVGVRTAATAHINTELEAKNSELERFVYTISHELKSPLVTIQGFLGFVKQDLVSGNLQRAQDDLNRITDATHTMECLLENLLTMSRIGRVINPPERISLGALAHEVVDNLPPQLTQQGVEIRIAPNLRDVYGDPMRLRELLHNLLENAIKFLGDQSEPLIEIGMRSHGSEWVYYVRDNGIGIAPRYHEKVFGLFERLAPDSDGTGIGLALVHRIIEVHGGRIWVESKGEGQGCTMCFTLPESPIATDLP